MGACFDYFTCSGTHSDVKKQYEYECDVALSESGNSYSGRINMTRGLKFHDNKIFESMNEAENYVSETAQKWSNAIAVQYRVTAQWKPSATLLKLRQQASDLRKKHRELNHTIREAVRARLKRVEFITCKTCKSRMDTRFVERGVQCPICNATFQTKTETKRLETIYAKIEKTSEKCKEIAKVLQEKADKKDKNKKIEWLVGGICSS